MYKKSAEAKHQQKLNKLLDNGFRFVVVGQTDFLKPFRYEYEAKRSLGKGEKVKPIKEIMKPCL